MYVIIEKWIANGTGVGTVQNTAEGWMGLETLKNLFLGPFYDIGRFARGTLARPPLTRDLSEEGLKAARKTLARVGCELSRCSVENLHTFSVDMELCRLFDLLMTWQQWPRSSFFPCSGISQDRLTCVAYRWWKMIPVVMMKLNTAERPHCIIYDIIWGIGLGGYHSFLIGEMEKPPAFTPGRLQTTLSIYTTFPQTHIFPEGLHDWVNYDIYRKLRSLAIKGN
jgi:hypothetical protein